jgi:uncharacterized protein (DUF952 family)
VQISRRDSNDLEQAPQAFARSSYGALGVSRQNTIFGMSKTIYKLARTAEWREALAKGYYSGSPDDIRDGFIHLSSKLQLPATLRRHFRGETDLVLIAFEEEKLGFGLKWETSRDGDLFPHLYGNLPISEMLWQRSLEIGADGVPLIPAEWLEC